MTDQEILAKAGELSQREGCRVHPLCFKTDGEEIVGFIREPQRIVKQRALDAAIQKGTTVAAGELLEALIIRDESDPRIFSDESQYDEFYFGASMACFELINISQNAFKKK
jgi:hypothetical protein